jgi:hypothetical protein
MSHLGKLGTAALAALLAGTGCASGAPEGSPGVAAQRESAADWKIFNVADLNGDGLADALWTSAATNRLCVWLLDGAHVLARGPELPGPPGEGWTPVTTGDFNHDGLSDVIWTNAAQGSMVVWLMDGAHVLAPGPVLPGPVGGGWVVANAGDTSGDGMADAVWYDATANRVAVWLMDGVRVLAPGAAVPGPPGEGWTVANVADTNGDGLADIVWSNPKTNSLTVWLMDGTHVLSRGPELAGPAGDGWTAVTTADGNRDGLSDVIWTNAGRGALSVWLLRGAQLLAPGPEIAGPAGDGWAVAYAADANGDGLADAIWQKAGTTRFAVWLMDGARVLSPGPELLGPGAGGAP